MRLVISFSVDAARDADILRWLQGLGDRERSARIRGALRAQLQEGPTLATVLGAILDLERKVGTMRAPAVARDGDEPAEAAAALDELGA